MSLHNGIDIVSWVSLGLYSETYSNRFLGVVPDTQNIANLYASLGMLEQAISPYVIAYYIKSIRNKGPRSHLGLSNLIGRHTRSVG